MSKSIKGFSRIAVLVLALAVFATPAVIYRVWAQGNLTNPGTMTNTIAALKAATGTWTIGYEDQSDYPSPQRRRGTIVRFYDFGVEGGATNPISLENYNVVTAIPDNTIIYDGFVQVVTPVLPATCSVSIGLNSVGDLYAAATTFQAAGTYPLIPNNATNDVQATNWMPLTTIISTGPATAGQFIVFMDAFYGQ